MELIKKGTAEKVRAICHEPQYPAATAKTIIDEMKRNGVEAALVEFDPMETAVPGELNAGWYEARMGANIDNLARALK
jgi:hypothetical protein